MSDQVTRPIEEPPSPPPPTVPSFQPLPPAPPTPAAQPPRKGMSIWLILLIIVLLCVLACCCVLALLTMMPALFGPSVGNVFSEIIEGLPAAP